eukprot:5313956-Karenia_brevis.AAC.1
MGPCARGEPGRAPNFLTHTGPYTRCAKCRLVLCSQCAGNHDEEARDRQELAKAVRTAREQPAPPYWQHPERPLPFYVMDHTKWPDPEKL